MEADLQGLKLTRQVGFRRWLGAILVQWQQSMAYLALYSTTMILMSLWSTWGKFAQAYAPWLNFPLFMLIGGLGGVSLVTLVGFLDYKFMYPSRQAFLNEQACKHENPAMDSLFRIEANQKAMAAELAEIKEALKKA